MRTFSMIVICLVLLGSLQGIYAAKKTSPVQKTVSLELKDTPLKEAITTLFKDSGYNFVLDPALNEPGYDTQRVSLKLQNVDFETALTNLTKAANLIYRREESGDGVYTISPKPSKNFGGMNAAPGLGGGGGAMGPGGAQPPPRSTGSLQITGMQQMPDDTVTIRIPAMPIKEAMAMVDLGGGWRFEKNLGDTVMPGASFYKFPKNMAAAMLLAAAGLKPPTGGDRVVTSRGKTDLSTLFQWTPPASSDQNTSSFGDYGGGGGGYGGVRGGSLGGQQIRSLPSAMAIGTYKAANNQWLFTVLLSQTLDIEAIEKLLATSDRNYFMDDLWNRYAFSKVTQSIGEGKTIESQQMVVKPLRNISAQLYDVTLDEALDNLVAAADLRYKKEGKPENPTYVIENPYKSFTPSDEQAKTKGAK